MVHFRIFRLIFLSLLIYTGSTAALASNQLLGHPSPYLALHGEDPVEWRSWQDEVFTQAKADNRLVFVSIGYFSCHWCHVMQQESYRDEAIAKVINRGYIAVKVDRELDPDLDQRLIKFVEKIRGSAGWPLNVFLTPDGYPITGFTYLPPENFITVLQQLEGEWRDKHEAISAAAQEFFLTQMQDFENQAFMAPDIPAAKLMDAFVSQSMLVADEMLGGFGNTSKFPNVPQLDALLEIIDRNPSLDRDVADFVQLTLHMMATKNLHDHVNDGFFRYTTDPDWQTPHYEKMLYDNAQLAMLYLKAQRRWPDRGYGEIAIRTLDFVEASLKHPDGGYMSSLSAVDNNNREGGAYLWTRAQLSTRLTTEEVDYLTRQGQFDANTEEFLIAALSGPAATGDAARNASILDKLKRRGSASMPTDNKRLASWNAMMLDALTLAVDIDERFAKPAEALFRSMLAEFYREGALIRFAGNAEVADAVLEDYAQVAHAFLNYGNRFENTVAIDISRRLVERAHSQFLKNDRWHQKSRSLIPIAPGKWVIPDLVFYSPMTLWLKAAIEVPGLKPEIRKSALQMLQRANREMLDSPYFYGSYIMLRITQQGS
ncbi:MAG: thioredoxin domain-containing protein [Gammaproteobacteria bacterium]|nr:thioredoxin domain-containing protein [Gammaproteobacteria bacterium]